MKQTERVFTRYQVFMIAILAILQFSVILDFMVLSPLGALLMQQLKIIPAQFGLVVSAYAFSAGISGLLTAGFADKFDRKKLLLFFYSGFLLGTLFCAVAPTYKLLLMARVVTGVFGGVIGSVSFAIISDLFKLEVRGRVMGFVQMAFSASQVLGIPVGLILANYFGWHAPFWMIGGFSIIVGIVIMVYMQPITAHLHIKSDRSPFLHLIKTITAPNYLKAYLCTTLLATGGFMLMPFGSAFSINNLKITLAQLPYLYGITGVFTIIFGPFLGKISDKLGKFRLFVIGTLVTMVIIAIYTRMGPTPLAIIIALNTVLFVGIMSRMISSSALITGVPEPQDRGAFMSINSSVQQISGGIAAAVAGLIVVQTKTGELAHYPTLGYVVIGSMIISTIMMYWINQYVAGKTKKDILSISGEALAI